MISTAHPSFAGSAIAYPATKKLSCVKLKAKYSLLLYDKPCYEYAKSYLEGAENRKTLEFYAQETKEGYETPLINDQSDFLQKAEKYYNECDYKAAAVYTRSAVEKAFRKYCQDKKKKIVFKPKLKDYTTEDFWGVVKADVNSSIQSEIDKYRALVLNPFSHYNAERHEIKTELKDAIKAVKNLKNELSKQS